MSVEAMSVEAMSIEAMSVIVSNDVAGRSGEFGLATPAAPREAAGEAWVDRAVRANYKPPARQAFGLLRDAQVAQLVEHATENRSVGGSIPPLGTMSKIRL